MMKYPEDFLNKIILGDCLQVMPTIPDNSIDMILCDLPYGKTKNKWDQIIDLDLLWREYRRIIKLKGVIALTSVQPFTSQLIVNNLDIFRYDLIWQKNKSTGFLNAKKMPLREHEEVLIFYKNFPVYNVQKQTGFKPVNSYTKKHNGDNYGLFPTGIKEIKGGGQTDRYPTSILKFSVVNNDSKSKIHSTQKPVELFEFLIKSYTNEEMVVLDNCIGSGTTAIACLNTNRYFIGIEKDVDYFDKAESRIKCSQNK